MGSKSTKVSLITKSSTPKYPEVSSIPTGKGDTASLPTGIKPERGGVLVGRDEQTWVRIGPGKEGQVLGIKKSARDWLDWIDQVESGLAYVQSYEPPRKVGVLWLDTSEDAGNAFESILPVVTVTEDLVITAETADLYSMMFVDTSSGEVRVTLPPVDTQPRYPYWIKNIGDAGNNVVVDGDGAEVEGEAELWVTDRQSLTIRTSLTAWWVV